MGNPKARIKRIQKLLRGKTGSVKIVDYKDGKYFYNGNEYTLVQLEQLKGNASTIIIDDI